MPGAFAERARNGMVKRVSIIEGLEVVEAVGIVVRVWVWRFYGEIDPLVYLLLRILHLGQLSLPCALVTED